MSGYLSKRVLCPICRGDFQGTCSPILETDPAEFDCETCGRFAVGRAALDDILNTEEPTPLFRALVAHRVRQAQAKPILTGDWLRALKDESLPTPAQQVSNLLRLIGDRARATGDVFAMDEATAVTVGAANPSALYRLITQVLAKKLLAETGPYERVRRHGGREHTKAYDLTLEGWERYEAERRGQGPGTYGFIAMKFGDAVLEDLVKRVIKPAVRDRLAYDLIDLRDVAQAGVIDNIMRAQIRDAAFVLVDLTHDNAGAYWEAGYAEGLGKPVIYLCERSKFDTAKTHFDTNHCTTEIWDTTNEARFAEALMATLRRSLNLFPDRDG